jgi:hypothetical protein
MQVPVTKVHSEIIGNLPDVKPAVHEYQDFANAQASALSQSVHGIGRSLTELGMQLAEDNNNAIVQNKLLTLQNIQNSLTNDEQLGFKNLLGINALDRPEGMSLTDEYVGQLDHHAQEITTGLKNNRQRELFQVAYGRIRNSFANALLEHTQIQNHKFKLDTAEAAIETGKRSFVLADSLEDKVFYGDQIRSMAQRKGQLLGWGAEQTMNEMRKPLGEAVHLSIAAMMDRGNFDQAETLLNRFKDDVDVDNYSKLSRAISDARAEQSGMILADQLDKNGMYVEEATGEEAIKKSVPRIIKVEGTGKNPFSSAVGVGQFIDSTWLLMIKHYRPDLAAGKSKEQILQLRKNSQIATQMVEYAVRKYAKSLQSSGLPVTMGNIYLSHFLGEAKAIQVLKTNPNAHVSSVLSSGVINANSFVKNMSIADLVEWAHKKMGGRRVPRVRSESEVIQIIQNIKDPQKRKSAMERHASNAKIKRREQEEQEAVRDNAAIKTLMQTDGDISAIKPSLKMQYSAKEWLKIQNLAESIRSRNEKELFQKGKYAYYDLRLNPEKLARLSENQVNALAVQFGPERALTLAQDRKRYLESNNKSNSPPSIVSSVFTSIAKAYGLPISFTKANPKQAQQLHVLHDNIVMLQQEYYGIHGRYPSQSELFDTAMKLQSQKVVTEQGYIWDTKTPVLLLNKEQMKNSQILKGK